MDTAQRQRALQFAQELAQAPSSTILESFRSDSLAVETKTDGSPVTLADRHAEALMRQLIRASPEFGDYQIQGEEGGLDGRTTWYRWVLDPIDGTVSFTRGIPSFGTIVALEETESEVAVVGVIHFPALGETYAAARGLGSWRSGQRLQASSATDLKTAIVSVPDPIQVRIAGFEQAFRRLWDTCDRLRGYTDCWAHALAVGGHVDAVVEPYCNAWDIRATQVLIEEAGGKQLIRPSSLPDTYDSLFGSPALVDQLAALLGF